MDSDGLRVHGVVDSLDITERRRHHGGGSRGGTQADISGIVTSSNADIVGERFVFTVVDKGEGANDPPDLVSPLSSGNGSDDGSGDDSGNNNRGGSAALVPIENGNIQVRP
jgi:hypothetical protein